MCASGSLFGREHVCVRASSVHLVILAQPADLWLPPVTCQLPRSYLVQQATVPHPCALDPRVGTRQAEG